MNPIDEYIRIELFQNGVPKKPKILGSKTFKMQNKPQGNYNLCSYCHFYLAREDDSPEKIAKFKLCQSLLLEKECDGTPCEHWLSCPSNAFLRQGPSRKRHAWHLCLREWMARTNSVYCASCADGNELHPDFFVDKQKAQTEYEQKLNQANEKIEKSKGKSEQDAREELQQALQTVKSPNQSSPASVAALQRAVATDGSAVNRS